MICSDTRKYIFCALFGITTAYFSLLKVIYQQKCIEKHCIELYRQRLSLKTNRGTKPFLRTRQTKTVINQLIHDNLKDRNPLIFMCLRNAAYSHLRILIEVDSLHLHHPYPLKISRNLEGIFFQHRITADPPTDSSFGEKVIQKEYPNQNLIKF